MSRAPGAGRGLFVSYRSCAIGSRNRLPRPGKGPPQNQVGIPVKLNALSEGKPNGIPG